MNVDLQLDVATFTIGLANMVMLIRLTVRSMRIDREYQKAKKSQPYVTKISPTRPYVTQISPTSVEEADEVILRLLAGGTFDPEGEFILPSGIKLSGAEMQAMVSFYLPEDHNETS